MRCLHTNIKFATLGGVQSILRAHHEEDGRVGIDSRFLVYLEPDDPRWPRARFADLRWGWSLRRTRRTLVDKIGDFEPDVAVYHTTFGMAYLADLDRSSRRLLYLHSPVPNLRQHLVSRLPWVDGVLAVGDELLEIAREAAPHFTPDRFQRIYAPIFPKINPPGFRPLDRRPLVLGYSGRIQVHDKRVERLPELCRQLDSAGIDYRFELLGDGPEKSRLEAQLPDRRRVVFHGLRNGDAYWQTLAAWDAIVFFSDREGLPLAQVEAMSLGVLPILPAVNGAADDYARRVDPGLVYPIGDMAALTAGVRHLILRQAQWPEWRDQARSIASAHDGCRYFSEFSGFLRRIGELPMSPRGPFPSRPFPVDFLPHWSMAPLARLRRRWSQLRKPTHRASNMSPASGAR